MLESTLTLGGDQFLATLKHIDEAVSGFKARIIGLSQQFEVLGDLRDQFDRIRESLDFGARMADLATQTGASAGDMALLSQAFENVGLGADGASAFASRLQKALSGLNEEGAETNTAFRHLGLNMGELRRMPMLDQINALQQAFQRIGNFDDRAKIATELFGKSGAEDIRFLVNIEGMDEAKEQVGGLKEVLDKNAEVFARLSHAFDALKVKAVQFYAGFAQGLEGNTEKLIQLLNKMDLTQWGTKLGEITQKVAAFIAMLKPLLPILELLAARWALSKLAATDFGAAISLALEDPRGALREIGLLLSSFTGKFAGINSLGAFKTRIDSLTASMGMLDKAFITASVAIMAWDLGRWLREKFTHEKEQIAESYEALGATQQTDRDISGFEGKRKSGLFSQADKDNLIKGIDEASQKLRDQLTDAETRYSGDRLDAFKRSIHNNLIGLDVQRRAAERTPLSYGTLGEFAGVPGRTPVSNLGRIGGAVNGIGWASSSDPHLSQLQQINQGIKNLVNAVTGSPTASRPPVYHST